MLNKYLKTEYEGLNLGNNVANLMASMIASDELVLRVLVEIAKKDRLLLNYPKTGDVDNEVVYGITKEELRLSIDLGERKATSGKYKGKMVQGYPAIKKIDSIIAFLMGTTIVYYEKHGNEKRYLYTMRSLEVFKVLCAKGYLNKEQIFPNIKSKNK